MAYVFYNPNPRYKRTGDCVIRAITKLMDSDWKIIYVRLCIQGLIDCDWGPSKRVRAVLSTFQYKEKKRNECSRSR
jgi:hypothetical protein